MPAKINGKPLRRTVPFILAACTAVSILSTDLITPSLPDFPEALDTSLRLAQMTISLNLAAYAIAQLVHGPLADAIGRKRLLVNALFLFILASIVCATASSIQTLLGGRFLQGLFSSVPSVVIVLLIRELYGGQQALKVMTLYGTVLGIAPALGPLLGGYLHVWFGWTAGFWFVAGLALVVLLLVWRNVPESLDSPKPLDPVASLRDYLQLLLTPDYIRPALAVSLGFSAFFAYVTTAPVIFIDILGLEPQQFGMTNIVIVGCFILGNIIASRLTQRFEAHHLLVAAVVVMMCGMAGLMITVSTMGETIVGILAAMGLYAVGLAFVLAAGPIVVLNQAAHLPQGPASALLGSLQLGVSAFAGFLAARFYDGTAVPMAVVMTAFVTVGAALLFWRMPRPLEETSEDPPDPGPTNPTISPRAVPE